MSPIFWRGRRVFMTGHTGFKGSWLALWLQSLGARVTGYALPPFTSPSLFDLSEVRNGICSTIGDIRDFDELHAAMAESEPEVVLHLAAQSLVRQSYEKPIETYTTNVIGTVHVLEAVRMTPSVRVVVSVTSDKCYANSETGRSFVETDALGGYDPYSSSKACAEHVTAAYRSSFFRSHAAPVYIATARAGNVIGGGDRAPDRLLPDVLRAFEAGVPAKIRNPASIRPWQHVLEPLRGYLELAECLSRDGSVFAEAWNFGPDDGDAKPVEWVVDNMVRLWGGSARWERDGGPHPHEARYLRLDTSKARSRMGWRPRLDLQQALAMTVDWSRAQARGEPARGLTLAQIAAYQEMCTQ